MQNEPENFIRPSRPAGYFLAAALALVGCSKSPSPELVTRFNECQNTVSRGGARTDINFSHCMQAGGAYALKSDWRGGVRNLPAWEDAQPALSYGGERDSLLTKILVLSVN